MSKQSNRSRYKSFLLIILLLGLFWSCEEDSSSDQGVNPEALVGKWFATGVESYVEITTNSDQLYVDPFSQGVGSISISGDVSTSLSYIHSYGEGGETYVVLMSEMFSEEMSFPAYYVEIYISPSEGYGAAQLIAMESDELYSIYSNTTVPLTDMSFDASTHSLTINPTMLIKFDLLTGEADSSLVVTLSGTLANQAISIPANVPTNVTWGEDLFEDNLDLSIDLMADGSLTIISSYGDSESDTSTGTWQSENDILRIYEQYEDNDSTYKDTIAAAYAFNAGTLILNLENNLCEDNDCEDIEEEFALESGSVIDIIQVVTYEFSQDNASAKRLTRQQPMKTSLAKNLQIMSARKLPFRK
jgi:hypothetical protein